MTTALEPLANRDELAAALGVPRSTVEYLHVKHKWAHVRVGKHIRYTPEQFDAIVRQHTVIPEKDEPKKLPGQTSRSASRKAAS